MPPSATLVMRERPGRVLVKQFHDADRTAPPLEPLAEAALRQFSQERLMAYGVDHDDARELRARVAKGEGWLAVARELAQACLHPVEAALASASESSEIARLFRASALERMSQMMFLRDNAERATILASARTLYAQASSKLGDRIPIAFQAEGGTLAGWLHHAQGEPVGAAIVIGGIEGWAMDFGGLGVALAKRGIEALLLDGPGQGETRIVHGHYFTDRWLAAYHAALDYLVERFATLPLGFVGNSMGGAIATIVAAADDRVAACINNGGPMYATRGVANPSFFQKMETHCGDVSHEQAVAVWATAEPHRRAEVVRCPYLIVHGGMDPLVSDVESHEALERAETDDKAMIVWSDGNHCIYNHEHDKLNLMSDWLAARLRAASGSGMAPA